MSIEPVPRHRYFLEVSYRGTGYSGFQTQKNANTIQAEIEKAWFILHRQKLELTGSSRTDAGVHALQNYFHFDIGYHPGEHVVYQLNAILPAGIVVKNLILVAADAHSRFDAIVREYRYYIYREKDPFLTGLAFFFPYKLDIGLMEEAAAILKDYSDFTSFSKRNTQVKSFICSITESKWQAENGQLIYTVKANRFLRGMVRALTATMLRVGRGKISLDEFKSIIEAKDCTRASFAVPAHGLFLMKVEYPQNIVRRET